jgi:periplasmic divalent cation tolerance protein
MLIVLTTTPSVDEAESLARKIVDSRLAACVQVLPQMASFYHWEGEIQREQENLLLIKTFDDKFAALNEFIHANHSYTVPEVVALEAEKISDGYLRWMVEYLRED